MVRDQQKHMLFELGGGANLKWCVLKTAETVATTCYTFKVKFHLELSQLRPSLQRLLLA